MIVLSYYREHRRRARLVAERGRPPVHGGPVDWFRWALIEQLEDTGYAVRNAFDLYVPLPAVWDLALSRWAERRLQRRRGWAEEKTEIPGCCPSCTARWWVGRCLRHRACRDALQRFADEYAQARS